MQALSSVCCSAADCSAVLHDLLLPALPYVVVQGAAVCPCTARQQQMCAHCCRPPPPCDAGGFGLPETVEIFGMEYNFVGGSLPQELRMPAAIRNYSLGANTLEGTLPQYALPEGLRFFNLGE